ncbi:MAG: glycosyl hydrolase [Desulforhabdus sp.]|jgi:hypothetical protein|nr:glycosyl hydrolase [Desulforhabdus sp.]
MKIQLIMAIILFLSLGTPAHSGAPSADNYEVFIEAENAVDKYGFRVVGSPRAIDYSGGKMLNLWQLNRPKPPGYYARYSFQVANDGDYFINIWVQNLKTPYSSPFTVLVDQQEVVFGKETALLLNQVKYGENITGYSTGPIYLQSGDHDMIIIVDQRRDYMDRAYNLLVDAIALSQKDPAIPEAPEEARLTVDATHISGSFSLLTDLSQGGTSDVIEPAFWRSIAPMISTLGTSLVRIDHIFDDDYYHVVQQKPDGSYEYDWTRLDAVVSEILKTGARPFFCLSYMPSALSRDYTPYQAPIDVNDWAMLCEELVRHMEASFNLTGLYYEVWNEPDLKEFWKGSQQDYFDLYEASVNAIKSADPSAKLGGPASHRLAIGWLSPFLEFVSNQELQLDFVSWHLYDQSPTTYSQNIQYLKQMLSDLKFPNEVEIMLTEWNSSGVLDVANDAFYNAAHTAAVLYVLREENISKAFFFMPKDYRNEQLLYGGWGLVTYDGRPKPSYNCFDAYRRLKDGHEVKVTSTENSVKAFSIINETSLRLLLWNYSDEQAIGASRKIKIVLNLDGSPLSSGVINKEKYLIDHRHSNINDNKDNPGLEMVESNSLIGKSMIEETILLENGGVMYLEFNLMPGSP